MDRPFTFVLVVIALSAGIVSLPVNAQTISLAGQAEVTGSGGSVVYSVDGATVATNVTDVAPSIGVQLFTLGAGGTLAEREFVSVADELEGEIDSVSSVALDPLGRGFGALTVIPLNNRTVNGLVVFFDYRAGTAGVLKTLTVGFHPDKVLFSRDGSRVFVANEGEFTGNGIGEGGGGGDNDAPGSISVIDLSSVEAIEDIEALGGTEVVTRDFSAPNLAAGVNLNALRFNDADFSPGNALRHVEPEAIAEGDEVLYVTLQENNAIAEFALSGPDEGKFTRIQSLATIELTIDASDMDGEAGAPIALIDDVVKGAPMPSSIATYSAGGVDYTITANTGAFRSDGEDRARISSFTGTEIGFSIDRNDAALGRLRVVRDLSDPDDEGLLEDVVIPGTRSFSIWNAATGELVGDTGSFESILLEQFPDLHNIDGEGGPGTFDFMSPEKGPEPRALAHGMIGANQFVFVGMARQGAILMYNVNDPANPVFVSAINSIEDGLVSPESIAFIPGSSSPSGTPFLLVGYGGGKIGIYRLADAAPIITVPGKITVKGSASKVTLKGRASANTALVTVNRKPARGTVNWSSKLSFPTSKKSLKVTVSATSVFGVTSSRKVTIVRKR